MQASLAQRMCAHTSPRAQRSRISGLCLASRTNFASGSRRINSSRRGKAQSLNATGQDNDRPPSPPSSNETSTSGSLSTSLAKWTAEIVANPLFYLVAGLGAIKIVSSFGESNVLIFLLAAAPVTLLTILSKSDVGKQVQDQLNEKLPELEAEAMALRAAHAEARGRSEWYGAQRPRLPGPLGSAPHLQGVMAGDYGFDPLGLGADAERLRYHYEAELLHARWAMMAAIGAPLPEVLALNGVALGEPVWWKVGAYVANGDITLNWGGIEGFRIAGKQGIGIIAACQAVLMGGPEYARYVGIKSLEPVGVFLPGEQNYPGGTPFDPLGLSKQPDYFADQSVREIKNGRIAMLAVLGYFAQAAVTRKGIVDNVVDFAADPAHNNIFYNLSHLPQ